MAVSACAKGGQWACALALQHSRNLGSRGASPLPRMELEQAAAGGHLDATSKLVIMYLDGIGGLKKGDDCEPSEQRRVTDGGQRARQGKVR